MATAFSRIVRSHVVDQDVAIGGTVYSVPSGRWAQIHFVYTNTDTNPSINLPDGTGTPLELPPDSSANEVPLVLYAGMEVVIADSGAGSRRLVLFVNEYNLT